MTLPDAPDYECPECGCNSWVWNEHSIWAGWECENGCVMVWHRE